MKFKIIFLVLGASSWMALGADFRFNAGNNSGWTYRLAKVTPGFPPIQIRDGAAEWSDFNNYPMVLNNPLGDNHGAAFAAVNPPDYDSSAPGDFIILQLVSPILTGDADWQAARSFSARLLPSYIANAFTPAVTANLIIFVTDLDSGNPLVFAYPGIATPIATSTWSYRDFDIAAALAAHSPPVVRYQLTQVAINFFASVQTGTGHETLPFDVDNVYPHCGAVTYSNEAAFRAAAGFTTTYGFETHGLSENVNDLPPSPITASDFDENFNIAYANLNGFNVAYSPGSPHNADGDRVLFTHSFATNMTVHDYSLTFSNFGGVNRAITAFGLTVFDFASGLSTPVSITYESGTDTGVLLTVPSGQADFTSNFVGVVVCPDAAFTSITLTFNDNQSGFQWFDKVIYSAGLPGGGPFSLVLNRDVGKMLLKWHSSSEKTYTVQTSSNLTQWVPMTNLPGQGPVTTFADPDIFALKKFYRILQNTNSN